MKFRIKKTVRSLVLLFSILFIVFFLSFSIIKGGREGLQSVLKTSSSDISSKSKFVVELRDKGFFPEKLSIKKGETVTFINKRNKPFWPASNTHPQHGIYPEFDPKRPIEPNQIWNFTFDRVGKWRYHDHVAPYLSGVINVISDIAGENLEDGCKSDDANKKIACWDSLLSYTLETKGLKETFKSFKKLYETEDIFRGTSCHRHAHELGEDFYGVYLKNKNLAKIDLPLETIACGYGFYHGFFEHMFRDEEPDIKKARTICDNLGKKYSDKMPGIRMNCYHAMGHGFMPSIPDKNVWGNPPAVLAVPMKRCEGVSAANDQEEIQKCLEGVFNVLTDWITSNSYGFSPDKSDYFDVCRKQPKRSYALACYFELSMRIGMYADEDLVKVAAFIKNLDDEMAKLIIHSAAAALIEVRLNQDDLSKYITICYSLEERLRKECTKGLVLGLVAHGDPGDEYKRGLNFCASSKLLEKDKELCFNNLIIFLKSFYTKEKLNKVCDLIDKKYRQMCSI